MRSRGKGQGSSESMLTLFTFIVNFSFPQNCKSHKSINYFLYKICRSWEIYGKTMMINYLPQISQITQIKNSICNIIFCAKSAESVRSEGNTMMINYLPQISEITQIKKSICNIIFCAKSAESVRSAGKFFLSLACYDTEIF